MTNRHGTYEDGDQSEHFIVKKDGFLEFSSTTNRTIAWKKLEVLINDEPVGVETVKDTEPLSYRWTLGEEIYVFANSDKLTFRVTYNERRGSGVDSKPRKAKIEMSHNHLIKRIGGKGEDRISESHGIVTVGFNVARVELSSIIETCSSETLAPLLPASLRGILASGNTFLQSAHPLPSVLEKIRVSEDALQVIDHAIVSLGEVNSLAKAILTALSIPYELLKNERKFKRNVQDLAETMRFTIKYVVDIRDHAKIESAKDQLISIMKTIRDAAQYVNAYVSKGRIGQFIRAQFPIKLDGFTDALVEQKNRFQIAMIIQIARNVDMITSMTVDDFLRKHLRPVENDEHSDGCLEGTRTKVLNKIRGWLQDHGSKNILWLQGPPGAGKTTIAATIAKELAQKPPFCTIFSCRRDVPELRDPRKIWPTLAYDLARNHGGVKAALVERLHEDKGSLRHDSVVELFHRLIRSPLENDIGEKRFRLRKSLYPLIIIDALDECFPANEDRDSWDSLLASLRCWSKLCQAGVVKLMITSRDLMDIRRTLNEVSLRVDLTTGNDALDDSINDVRTFFEAKFSTISERFPGLPAEWPNNTMLRELTDYAAGLFVWADMVVRYVGFETGGSDPGTRLKNILKDIDPQTGSQQKASGIALLDKVDLLYARIIYEAFLYSDDEERDLAKRFLATVVLAKEPLRRNDITELLLAGTSNPDSVSRSIESTRRVLAPIIPISDFKMDANEEIRVSHKTVSDFLLSGNRSAAVMKDMHDRIDQKSRGHISGSQSLIIECGTENIRFALACVRLISISRNLRDIRSTEQVLKLSGCSLDYAFRYWFDHLKDAGAGRTAHLKCLAKAMEVAYRSLRRYNEKLMEVQEEAVALVKCLQVAAEFASRCIGLDQLEVEDVRQETIENAKNVDFARGKFQIAVVEKSSSESLDSFLRKRLHPSDQTVLDSPCLEGTRISVLKRVKEWAEDPEQPNILWIVGAPGAGKSAIATTLVDEVFKDSLCVKAFSKRDFEDRRDPIRIWHTLTFSVASSGLHVGLKGSILEELSKESSQSSEGCFDILTKALQYQQHLSIVFVLDALDECFTEQPEDERSWRALVQSIASWFNLPRSVKLVVTSRDIPEIRMVLEDISSTITLKAEANDAIIETKSDMGLYFRTKLEEIFTDSEEMHLYWTQANIIRQLIEYAADSFIWAKMVLELVKLKPHSRVDDILRNDTSGHDGTVTSVDALYADILFNVLGSLTEKEREFFRAVLAFVVLAKNPLREADLVELLQASPSLLSSDETHRPVAEVIKELSSVISVGDNKLLRIPHKSFVDFLLDSDHDCNIDHDSNSDFNGSSYRDDISHNDNGDSDHYDSDNDRNNNRIKDTDCDMDRQSGSQSLHWDHGRSLCAMKQLLPAGYDPRSFIVNREEDSAKFTIACLQLMNNTLIFNMSVIETSHVLNHEISGLGAPIEKNIKNSLIYACRFWAEHLSDCDRDDQRFRGQVEAQLEKLFNVNFLYWMEVLSLAKAVPSACTSMDIVHDFLEEYENGLMEVVGDAYKFIMDFKERIAAAAPHIYLSALPSCSLEFDSEISRIYGPHFDIVPGMRDRWMDWDAGETTLDAHTDSVRGVAFFPDGRKLASGSIDKTVRIWDAKTGEALSAPFTGHDSTVHSIAVSMDGSQIASGDFFGNLRIWDSNTGTCPLGSINAHNGYIYSVVFSPDGSCIVTGSYDNSVKVWNVASGDLCLGPLMGHTDDVNSVAFSIDATVIASGSADKTICIWDAHTGSLLREPLTEHYGSVTCVAFSTNGNYLASGSWDETVRLWDVAQGFSPMCTINVGSTTLSISFSPNSNCLVSGSDNGALRFWNVTSGVIKQIGDTIYGHTDGVPSVAFAPCGHSVASGSYDSSIKVWSAPYYYVQSPATTTISEGYPSPAIFNSEFLDSLGFPVLDDNSFVDEQGWLRTSRRNGENRWHGILMSYIPMSRNSKLTSTGLPMEKWGHSAVQV